MDISGLLMQVLGGALGGNAAGAVLKSKSLGPIGNTIAGLIGGGITGQIVGQLVESWGPVQSLGSSAVGGALVMVVLSWIKNAMAAKGTGA